ncbi:unnamed protein product [Rotaria sp. Silwood1]|nr:unnamed protein product [Rotaria sp. Silwood1]CAF3666129.1 unnamed protein product [Rotaria sp. Silwood1]
MLVVFDQLVVHLKHPYLIKNHIITKTKPVSLDNLSPVVRQILSKDPSYAVRFVVNYLKINNILFNNIQEQLVELKISSRQIPKDDFILETNEDENDLPHPPIVAFPSIENHFHMDLETEDPSIPIHETARCFGCGASLQCADKTKPEDILFLNIIIYLFINQYSRSFIPVEI